MKLLFCTECWDVIKLAHPEVRACECGKVVGGYDKNEATAWSNGKGISIAIDNYDLVRAVKALAKSKANGTNRVDRYKYPINWNFRTWVRPNDGFFNLRTRIIHDWHERNTCKPSNQKKGG